MSAPGRTQLEVWGDPIAHSRSPELHAAAYRILGLPWSYGRRQVAEEEFDAALAALGTGFRGLSLTMPLKRRAYAAAETRDRRAELSGAVNTLVLGDGAPRGFNTDVGGIVGALGDAGVGEIPSARIVGAGATATSALLALAELGARRVEIVARRPLAVLPLQQLGDRLGVTVKPASFGTRGAVVPATVSTLPGSAGVDDAAADTLAESGGVLLDVVYGHGPTALLAAWDRAGARASDGLGMLLRQAVLQVRAFVTGGVDEPLDAEDAVVSAMRAALVGG